jgi:hypothetical protein
MQAVTVVPLSSVQQVADDHHQITIMQEQAQVVQNLGIGVGVLCVLFAIVVIVKKRISGPAVTEKLKTRAASA